jgi:tetratricopeptide (TPR) repeat protein
MCRAFMTLPNVDFAKDTFEAFVRGDAMIGIIANAPEREAQMIATFWGAAQGGDAASWKALGDIFFARLAPIGAYDGAQPAPTTPWPKDAPVFDPADPQRDAALRCYALAARLNNEDALKALLVAARAASAVAQRAALNCAAAGVEKGLASFPYERGCLHYRLGEHKKAAELHSEAVAEGGHANACFELYCLHSKGEGVAKDAAKADEFLRRAAKLGQPRALYNLGAMYATGSGVEQSWQEAVKYYEQAARWGSQRAALTLAEMHTVGQGVPKDDALAQKWADLANEASAEP